MKLYEFISETIKSAIKGLGAKSKGTEENQIISRINFSVAVALPNTEYNL